MLTMDVYCDMLTVTYMYNMINILYRILHLEKINTSLQADLQKREKELQEVS